MSTITKTLLSDGPSKAVLSVYMQSDGVEGELVNYLLLDPQVDLAVPVNDLSILQIWYSFGWFDGLLAFDDVVPVPAWNLSRDGVGYCDFRYFGGFADRAGIDKTGKIFLTTSGFAVPGSTGTLVIEVKKH